MGTSVQQPQAMILNIVFAESGLLGDTPKTPDTAMAVSNTPSGVAFRSLRSQFLHVRAERTVRAIHVLRFL